MKIIKAAMTEWLTDGESYARITSRSEPLIEALDVIYFEKKGAEVKGVSDLLLDPDLVCMLLLLLEVLVPVNILSKFLQRSMLFYCFVTEGQSPIGVIARYEN